MEAAAPFASSLPLPPLRCRQPRSLPPAVSLNKSASCEVGGSKEVHFFNSLLDLAVFPITRSAECPLLLLYRPLPSYEGATTPSDSSVANNMGGSSRRPMYPHFRKVVICRASEAEERICHLHIMWETRRRRRRLSHLPKCRIHSYPERACFLVGTCA